MISSEVLRMPCLFSPDNQPISGSEFEQLMIGEIYSTIDDFCAENGLVIKDQISHSESTIRARLMQQYDFLQNEDTCDFENFGSFLEQTLSEFADLYDDGAVFAVFPAEYSDDELFTTSFNCQVLDHSVFA